MRLALCNEVVASLDFEAQCAFAAAVGYDGLELAPFTLAAEPHLLPAGERRELVTVARDHGLALTGLHFVLRAPPGLSITAADPATRARTLDVIERLCGLCAELGGSYLVHGSPDQRRLEPDDEAGGRERGIAAIAQAAAAAGRAGVTYLLEPLGPDQTAFVNTVEEAAEIVRAIDHPALSTMLDCASAAVAEAEPVAAVLDRWLPTGLIGHVHVNDPNRQGPGQGALDLGPVVAALKRHGYRGAIGVEPFVYVPDGPAAAARAAGYMRALLGAIR